VSKSASNPAPRGHDLNFCGDRHHNGRIVSGVAITDNLPAGVTLVLASPSQGTYAGGVWAVGSVANGVSETLNLTVSVDPGTAGTTITNTATVSASDQTDPDPATNTASAVITPVAGPSADLTLSKTVDNPNPAEGWTISYWVQVTNNGPDNADGIQVTGYSAGTTYVNQGGPGVTTR
jgi:uncharacterized repeat protein (TIGR01451 family)